MRGSLVALAAVLGTVVACSHSYGETDAPPAPPPTEVPEAGPGPEIEGGVDSELDASKADADADAGADTTVNCVTADPTAVVCFDFDMHSVTVSPFEESAQAAVRTDAAGNGTLVATVDAVLPPGKTAAAYYDVQIAGSPAKVRWKFDLRLDASATSGVHFVLLDTSGPNSSRCQVEPELTTDAITLIESCSGSDRALTTVPITRNGHWWTFEFALDFTSKIATIDASDHGSQPTVSSSGPIGRATNGEGSMLIALGIDYADSTAVNAVYAMDNFYLYY